MAKDAHFQLYFGLLDFAVNLLKKDLEYWWKHHRGKKGDQFPLVRVFAKDTEKAAAVVIEDIELAKAFPKLYEVMIKLLAVIGTYFGAYEDRDSRTLNRKNSLKKKISVDFDITDYKTVEDVVIKTSLLRPSWLSSLVFLRCLKEEQFHLNDDLMTSYDPEVKAILKKLPSKTLIETMERNAHPALAMSLLTQFLHTYPVHAIARLVLKDKNVIKDNLKTSKQLRSDKKDLVKSSYVRFDNYVSFKKADLISDLRGCIDLIARLQIQKQLKPTLWHFA